MKISKILGEKKGPVRFLNLAIILVCVAIFVTAVLDIVGFAEAGDDRIAEEQFRWALEYEDYYRLEEMTRRDTSRSRKKEEYYALGEYFHEAVMYQAFLTAGDTERAEASLQRMQAAEENMGSFQMVKDKIDEKISQAVDKE